MMRRIENRRQDRRRVSLTSRELNVVSPKMTILAALTFVLFAVYPSSAFHILQTTPSTRSRRIPEARISNPQTTSSVRAGGTPISSYSSTNRRTVLLAVIDEETTKGANMSKSTTTTLRRRLHNWKCWLQFWKNQTIHNLTTRSYRKNDSRRKTRAAKVIAASLASVGGLSMGTMVHPSPAMARTVADNILDGTQKYSLRPGVTKEQADQLASGVMPDEVKEMENGNKATASPSSPSSSATPAKSDDLYGDYDDEEDDDDFDYDAEFGDNAYGNAAVAPNKQRQKSFSADSQDVSSEVSKGTKSSFSGISSNPKDTKTKALYVKVGASVFMPTLGFFGARDFLRNRREAKDVAKSIAIMDAQYEEYFGVDKNGNNVTKAEDELDDDEDDDELANDDDDDEDDDEEDDDDDEDEPPRRQRRSLPKPPSGPQGGGGTDGSGDIGGGGTDDGPSDDDVRRLRDMFDKS